MRVDTAPAPLLEREGVGKYHLTERVKSVKWCEKMCVFSIEEQLCKSFWQLNKGII